MDGMLMDPLPSTAERIESVGAIVTLTGLILGVGIVLLWVIGRGSSQRAYHGRFVLGWMASGWAVCGLIGSCTIDNNQYLPGETDVGFAGFGLLGGWAIGMTHGIIALRNENYSLAMPSSNDSRQP